MPQPPTPKSLVELELQRERCLRALLVWQTKARAWAADRGMELPEEVTPEQFFDWLAQMEEEDYLWRAARTNQ